MDSSAKIEEGEVEEKEGPKAIINIYTHNYKYHYIPKSSTHTPTTPKKSIISG